MSKVLLLTVTIVCSKLFPELEAANLTCFVTEDFSDCEGREESSISRFFDGTNLEVDWTDDGYMILDGYVIFLVDTDPNHEIYLRTDLQKRKNGRWAAVGLEIVRKDFCSDLMNPKEMWYETTREFSKSGQHLCPPQKGTKFSFNKKIVEINVLDAPNSSELEGDFRVTMDFNTMDIQICTFATVTCAFP